MGGDVQVESDGIGHGTTFVITMRTISKVSKNSTYKPSTKTLSSQYNSVGEMPMEV